MARGIATRPSPSPSPSKAPRSHSPSKGPPSHSLHLGGLRALDGLRALACTGVVAFHAAIVYLHQANVRGLGAPDGGAVLAWSLHGAAGVDVFFVLTGLLATLSLVPALEAAPTAAAARRVVAAYWRRRARRLVPAFLAGVALGLGVAFLPGVGRDAAEARTVTSFAPGVCSSPARLARTLLFVANWVDGLGACGVHFWSLDVTVQFCAAFPLLLLALRPRAPGFRRRLALALAAAAAFDVAYRAHVAAKHGMRMPMAYSSLYGGRARPAALDRATFWYYQSINFAAPARLLNLAAGAAVGLVLLSPRATAALRAAPAAPGAAAAAGLAALAALVWRRTVHGIADGDAWPAAEGARFLTLLWYGSPLMAGTAAAAVLALALRGDGASAAAARALGAAPLRALGRASYHVYAVNYPAVFLFVHWFLPQGFFGLAGAAPAAAARLLAAGSWAVAVALGSALYKVIG